MRSYSIEDRFVRFRFELTCINIELGLPRGPVLRGTAQQCVRYAMLCGRSSAALPPWECDWGSVVPLAGSARGLRARRLRLQRALLRHGVGWDSFLEVTNQHVGLAPLLGPEGLWAVVGEARRLEKRLDALEVEAKGLEGQADTYSGPHRGPRDDLARLQVVRAETTALRAELATFGPGRLPSDDGWDGLQRRRVVGNLAFALYELLKRGCMAERKRERAAVNAPQAYNQQALRLVAESLNVTFGTALSRRLTADDVKSRLQQRRRP